MRIVKNNAYEIEPKIHPDNRGFFFEAFKKSTFVAGLSEEHRSPDQGVDFSFKQINISQSRKNVFRGMHMQRKYSAQGKLVYCVHGSIVDVVVNLDTMQVSYYQLDSVRFNAVYVPPKFLHGFWVLSSTATVMYCCSGSEYDPHSEIGVNVNDPDLGISLSRFADGKYKLIMSEKDRNAPFLRNIEP